MYLDLNGNIFNYLNEFLQESPVLPIIILIALFCIKKQYKLNDRTFVCI
jgi:hypothetical protein